LLKKLKPTETCVAYVKGCYVEPFSVILQTKLIIDVAKRLKAQANHLVHAEKRRKRSPAFMMTLL
jgi:hypothetical protein